MLQFKWSLLGSFRYGGIRCQPLGEDMRRFARVPLVFSLSALFLFFCLLPVRFAIGDSGRNATITATTTSERSLDDSESAADSSQGSSESSSRLGESATDESSDEESNTVGDAMSSGPSDEDDKPSIDKLASEHKGDIVDGYYLIRSFKDRWKVFDVAGGSMGNGANLQLYGHNSSNAQRWRITHQGDYIVVTNVGSGKVLDVAGGSDKKGANVQQYAWNGTKAQLWVAVKSDGGIKLVSALNPELVVDLSGGSVSNGTNIQLYSDNGTAAQRWQFSLLPINGQTPASDLAGQCRGVLTDGDYFIAAGVGNRQVLDAAGGSKADGTNIQTYESNMTAAQKWHVSNNDDGTISVINVASGKALDVSAGSIVLGSNVQLYHSNSSLAQKWIARKVSSANGRETVILHSALFEDIVLDVAGGSSRSGSNVQTYASNGSLAQRFTFVPITPEVAPCAESFEDGWYQISPASGDASVFDVAGGLSSDGANIRLWSSNDTLAQLFKFEFVDGYYVIRNAKTGKVLDVSGGNPIAPTNVQQWAYSKGCANQLWSISANDDGSYRLTNKATGLVLDLNGGSTASGTNIQVYLANGTAAQNFSITPAKTLIPSGIVSIAAGSDRSKCLDVSGGSKNDGANVQIYQSNGTLAQKWLATALDDAAGSYTFESLNSGQMLTVQSNGNVCQAPASDDLSGQTWVPIIVNGAVTLKNLTTDKVLDIHGGSLSNGTNVQSYEANGTAAQSFEVSNVSVLADGCYEIASSAVSGQRFDVAGGSFADGSNIQWYASNGSGAQKWSIKNNGGDVYSITNADTGKSLDIKNAAIAVGTNVQQWSSNGSAAQSWRIAYVHRGAFEIRPSSNTGLAIGSISEKPTSGSNLELVNAGSAGAAVTFASTSYYSGSVLGVSRASLVRWLSSHQYDGYYLGTRYDTGLSVDRCTYPNGARRWDGFAGMNCAGFVAHAYAAVGGNVWPINATNSHSPWNGGPGRGGYVNAWRWYGYAVDTGHIAYTFNTVSDLLRSGVARKGDLIFFKANPRYDCHIGFFWGDTPSDNKLWSSYSPANAISPIFNSDDPYEIDQQIILIR